MYYRFTNKIIIRVYILLSILNVLKDIYLDKNSPVLFFYQDIVIDIP